jgi:hypothetical protein
MTVVLLRDQAQSELKVLLNTQTVETPKVSNYAFTPADSRPLPLVSIKQVLGVPLANEISEVMAQPQRLNNP